MFSHFCVWARGKLIVLVLVLIVQRSLNKEPQEKRVQLLSYIAAALREYRSLSVCGKFLSSRCDSINHYLTEKPRTNELPGNVTAISM